METEEQKEQNLWKIVIVILGLLTSGATSLAVWTTSEVVNHGRTLSSINSSRCTSQDCSAIRESLGSLRAELNSIPKEVPPKWFLNDVNSLKLKQASDHQELERRLSTLERLIWSNLKIDKQPPTTRK